MQANKREEQNSEMRPNNLSNRNDLSDCLPDTVWIRHKWLYYSDCNSATRWLRHITRRRSLIGAAHWTTRHDPVRPASERSKCVNRIRQKRISLIRLFERGREGKETLFREFLLGTPAKPFGRQCRIPIELQIKEYKLICLFRITYFWLQWNSPSQWADAEHQQEVRKCLRPIRLSSSSNWLCAYRSGSLDELIQLRSLGFDYLTDFS